MDKGVRENLEGIGVDVGHTLNRYLGREELFFKFLRKFLDDKSYEELCQAAKQREYQEAFKYAHTLKGISANLGLGQLYDVAYKLTEELRTAPYEEEEIIESMLQIQRVYNQLVEVIKQL